jgi:uncharacterized protein (TIGR00255 family)
LIKSMTAYGRGEYSQGTSAFTVELKSYNNRFRDIVLRIPRTLQALEDEIRLQVSSRVRRGRVEVSIQMETNSGEGEYQLELNAPLVKSYLRIFRELDEEYGLHEKVSPDSLCQMKDIITFKTPDVDIDDVRPGLKEALGLAVESLDKMKMTEGKAIEEDSLKRLDIIEEYLNNIEENAPKMVDEYKKRLEDKIQRVSGGMTLDESRLIQEVAIFADRCDITEEIVRFRSHLKQYRDFMSKDDSIGRRLDFLIQEINREVNTIGSKATDSFISSTVVEIKAELEKLREQVQNVE